jgi:hypothetical protein
MPYDLDAMEAQINAAMESPDRVRFRPGATYDPKRRLGDYDNRQYGYKRENMTILGSCTSQTATKKAEAGLHQRMRSHPKYDRRLQQPQSLGRDDKSRYYIYFTWTDPSSKTTWERMQDLVAALLTARSAGRGGGQDHKRRDVPPDTNGQSPIRVEDRTGAGALSSVVVPLY